MPQEWSGVDACLECFMHFPTRNIYHSPKCKYVPDVFVVLSYRIAITVNCLAFRLNHKKMQCNVLICCNTSPWKSRFLTRSTCKYFQAAQNILFSIFRNFINNISDGYPGFHSISIILSHLELNGELECTAIDAWLLHLILARFWKPWMAGFSYILCRIWII